MMLQKIGMRVDDLAATGKAMALSELNLKYFAPLRVYQICFFPYKPINAYSMLTLVKVSGNFIQVLKFISRVVTGLSSRSSLCRSKAHE
jgi:hypothetical protein